MAAASARATLGSWRAAGTGSARRGTGSGARPPGSPGRWRGSRGTTRGGVGLALTLVSVFYYVTPLFNGWGDSTIWAVITVVFVMEFTVGWSWTGSSSSLAGTTWTRSF